MSCNIPRLYNWYLYPIKPNVLFPPVDASVAKNTALLENIFGTFSFVWYFKYYYIVKNDPNLLQENIYLQYMCSKMYSRIYWLQKIHFVPIYFQRILSMDPNVILLIKDICFTSKRIRLLTTNSFFWVFLLVWYCNCFLFIL